LEVKSDKYTTSSFKLKVSAFDLYLKSFCIEMNIGKEKINVTKDIVFEINLNVSICDD